jgi:hypothetical protein
MGFHGYLTVVNLGSVQYSEVYAAVHKKPRALKINIMPSYYGSDEGIQYVAYNLSIRNALCSTFILCPQEWPEQPQP